jgi:hypothetical protein
MEMNLENDINDVETIQNIKFQLRSLESVYKDNLKKNTFHQKEKKIRLLRSEIKKLQECLMDISVNPSTPSEILEIYRQKILEKEIELQKSIKPSSDNSNNLMDMKETLETNLEYLEDKLQTTLKKIQNTFPDDIHDKLHPELHEKLHDNDINTIRDKVKLQKILEKKQKLEEKRGKEKCKGVKH